MELPSCARVVRRHVAGFVSAVDSLPPEIRQILGQDAELVFAIPENKVPLPGGRRESQCDVFALIRTPSTTITLADGSPGKQQRLEAICDLLGCPTLPGHLRYQLYHRPTATIVEADRMHAGAAAMIVQSFSQEHRWFDDFAAFCTFLGVEATRSAPMTRPLPDGRDPLLGWAIGDPSPLPYVVQSAKRWSDGASNFRRVGLEKLPNIFSGAFARPLAQRL